MESKDYTEEQRVTAAKNCLKNARSSIYHAIDLLECDHSTADKCGPLHTLTKRIDLWISRENNFEKQPSR